MAAHGTTKRDRFNQGWERGADFPIVCETCLGPNAYVRMTKHQSDKECKTCQRPFTVFRWKAGNDGRHKKTEICQTCAKLKNVCQTCLLDLEYGLPTQVRDAALNGGLGVLPSNDFNRDYYIMNAEKQLEEGLLPAASRAPEASQVLQKLARSTPYYKRNAPHICSFFVKGACNRGAACPFRHEMPPEESELSHQNIVDRYQGTNDPVAEKLLKKVEGYVPKTPDDQHNTTLYIGGLTDEITEEDLRDKFYLFGEIKSIRMVHKSSCAFVSFASRASAEKAVEVTHHALTIKNKNLKVDWGRPQTLDPAAQTRGGGFVGAAATYGANAPAAATSGSSAAVAAPPGLGQATAQVPYYPSMDPALFGSRPSFKPINLAPE